MGQQPDKTKPLYAEQQDGRNVDFAGNTIYLPGGADIQDYRASGGDRFFIVRYGGKEVRLPAGSQSGDVEAALKNLGAPTREPIPGQAPEVRRGPSPRTGTTIINRPSGETVVIQNGKRYVYSATQKKKDDEDIVTKEGGFTRDEARNAIAQALFEKQGKVAAFTQEGEILVLAPKGSKINPQAAADVVNALERKRYREELRAAGQKPEQPAPVPDLFGAESIEADTTIKNPVLQSEAEIQSFIETNEGTFQGILAGSAFSVYRYGKGFISGSIAVINPKTYYDLVKAALNPQETRDQLYQVGPEIVKDPGLLFEIGGQIKGFSYTSGKITEAAIKAYTTPRYKTIPAGEGFTKQQQLEAGINSDDVIKVPKNRAAKKLDAIRGSPEYYRNYPTGQAQGSSGANPLKAEDLLGGSGGGNAPLIQGKNLGDTGLGKELSILAGRHKLVKVVYEEEIIRGAIPVTTQEVQRIIQLRSLGQIRAAQRIGLTAYSTETFIGGLNALLKDSSQPQISVQPTKVIQPSKSDIKAAQAVVPAQIVEVTQEPTAAQIVESRQILSSRSVQEAISIQDQQPQQEQEQIQKQIPILVQIPITEPVQIQENPQIQIPEAPQLLVPKIAETKLKEKQDLFTTFVRRRGKFQAVGSFPDIEQAISVGANIVQGTAAASFKVKGPAGQIQNAFKSLNRAVFRESKKDSGVVVERTKFRINTPGEFGEITLKGIAATRRKGKNPLKNIFGG